MIAVVAVIYTTRFQGGDVDESLYTTVTSERGDVVQAVATSGSVQALITVEVGSQLSGQIEEIFVDFNDVVKSGDLIAMIDQQTFSTRVAQSAAVFTSRQQRITLSLDIAPVLAAETLVFTTPDFIEGL